MTPLSAVDHRPAPRLTGSGRSSPRSLPVVRCAHATRATHQEKAMRRPAGHQARSVELDGLLRRRPMDVQPQRADLWLQRGLRVGLAVDEEDAPRTTFRLREPADPIE